MATVTEKDVIRAALRAVSGLLQLPATQMWVDYDRKADVLYINLRRPPVVADGEMTEDGIIIRRQADEIVGITVLDASQRG